MQNDVQQNARDLEQELAWIARVLDTRFKLYFGHETEHADIFDIAPPDLSNSESRYAEFVRNNDLSFAERIAVTLGLVPYIRPQLLDAFFTKNKATDRPYSEFGGADSGGGFVPTGETLAFIVAGVDLETRFGLHALLSEDHFLAQHDILRIPSGSNALSLKFPLRLTDEYLTLFTSGHRRRPIFGADFPAHYIETQLDWDELVLDPDTREQVEEIAGWLRHGETLMHDWGMAGKLGHGYRSLFFGPPGTGKTMTACLLGKSTDRDVYRIDLSLVVSNYVGETERNLDDVFRHARRRGWILLFDEADAVPGKHSQSKDDADHQLNVSYLLQRLENFDGVAIFESTGGQHLDTALLRRFQSIIHFRMPGPEARLRLWQQGFSAQAELDASIDLNDIAAQYELSGGQIMNVIRYASLRAIEDGSNSIALNDLTQGIRRELAREGTIA